MMCSLFLPGPHPSGSQGFRERVLPRQSKRLAFYTPFLLTQLVVKETMGNVFLTLTTAYKLGAG